MVLVCRTPFFCFVVNEFDRDGEGCSTDFGRGVRCAPRILGGGALGTYDVANLTKALSDKGSVCVFKLVGLRLIFVRS